MLVGQFEGKLKECDGTDVGATSGILLGTKLEQPHALAGQTVGSEVRKNVGILVGVEVVKRVGGDTGTKEGTEDGT